MLRVNPVPPVTLTYTDTAISRKHSFTDFPFLSLVSLTTNPFVNTLAHSIFFSVHSIVLGGLGITRLDSAC